MKSLDYTKREFYGTGDTGLTYASVCIFPQIVGLILFYILKACGVGSGSIGMILLSCLVGQVFYFGYYILYNRGQGVDWKKASGINFKLKWWQILLPIGLALVCIFGFNNFITLTDKVWELVGYKANLSIGLPMTNFGWFVLNIILLAIIPAICEELIFRGIIFGGMRDIGDNEAVVFSAFLFALFHGNASQTIYQFMLGIVLAYTFVITKNLLCPIILHFTNNFTVLLINYIGRDSQQTAINFNAIYIIFSIVGAIAAGVVVWLVIWLFKRKEATPTEDGLEKAQAKLLQRKTRQNLFTNKYLWFGMIFAFTIWVLDFVM